MKKPENHRFSDCFWANRIWFILLNSLNNGSEIWRRYFSNLLRYMLHTISTFLHFLHLIQAKVAFSSLALRVCITDGLISVTYVYTNACSCIIVTSVKFKQSSNDYFLSCFTKYASKRACTDKWQRVPSPTVLWRPPSLSCLPPLSNFWNLSKFKS